jgi:hypothetical protein
VVRLGRRIGKNGSRRWVSAGRGDEIKKKSTLAVENLDHKSQGNIENGF